MRRGPWSSLALLVAGVAAAGCAEPVVRTSDAVFQGPRALIDETRGGIEGAVTDESLVPVAGALILLENASTPTAVSDGAGRFAFSLVEAGTYSMLVEVNGFGSARKPVTVIAGDVVRADVAIARIAGDVVYHFTSIVEGYLGCSVAVYVRPIDRWQPANVCGIPGVEDEYLVATPITGTHVSRLQSIVFETEWTSTQLLGSGLNVRISIEADAGSNEFNSPFWDVRGQSPLKFVVDRVLIEEMGAGEPSFFAKCEPQATCHFELATYPWPNTAGSSSPVDVGVNVEQRFRHYVTEFYGEPAAGGFSARPDA